MKQLIIGVVALVIVVAFGYGMWHVARVWNYSLSYELMVQETIREMVKPEALQEQP